MLTTGGFPSSNELVHPYNILKSFKNATGHELAHVVQCPSGMYSSAFNLYVQDYPAAGETLVHNTFSGAYVIVDERQSAILRAAERGTRIAANDLMLLDIDGWRHPDIGVLVEDRRYEAHAYRTWFDEQRSQGALHAIISVNLACNFECPYCLQADVMNGSVMKSDVLEHTADWLARRAIATDAKHARLTFVGGEPLLHPKRIEALAARVTEQIAPHGIALKLGLITNGYFLTESMVADLVAHGLDVAQVTLDGDETTHHLSRVAKSGENTFQRIFDNIVAASRHIRIAINGNYQAHTISGFAPLVDKLASANMPPATLLHFTPALETLSASTSSVGGTCSWSDANHEHRVALYDRIVESGFSTGSLNSVGPCGFHKYDVFAIDPHGNVFKCPGFLGHPEWRIGHVSTGLTERYQQFIGWNTTSTCGDCGHRPNCAGGCVADEIIRTGEMTPKCELPYLDSMRQHALPREYLLAVNVDRTAAIAQFPSPPDALPSSAPPRRGVRPAALRIL